MTARRLAKAGRMSQGPSDFDGIEIRPRFFDFTCFLPENRFPLFRKHSIVALKEVFAMRYKAAILGSFLLVSAGGNPAAAASDGIVSMVVSSPIFANGTVRGIRSGINIYLQRDGARGLEFMNPEVTGYGIPPGGRMEVEMVEGFRRDPNIPLAQPSILLVAGTPQQGLPGRSAGYTVGQGNNENTFVIMPTSPRGLTAIDLKTKVPGAKRDPIPQRGIKIVHVGMTMAFVSRGERGRVEVRIYDGKGKIVSRGAAEIKFLAKPRPQIFPTNIPQGKRNHNWQRVAPGETVGATSETVPLSFLLFERNEGFGNKGIMGAGVLSAQQLATFGFSVPPALKRYTAGLILQDSDGDGLLNPSQDKIIGGITIAAPRGAKGHQVSTPLVRGNLYLSSPTRNFSEVAGRKLGGAIMLLEFVAGNKKGLYRPTFALLSDPDNIASGDGSVYSYTIVVE
ncbi:hypothetical protein BMS3Bbin10_00089 [bacterium BMS3Bbin10]|nr:hypothetical protein BMS3Bbin10_00089 [bacterium BMS3Bbin10]